MGWFYIIRRVSECDFIVERPVWEAKKNKTGEPRLIEETFKKQWVKSELQCGIELGGDSPA